MEKTQVYIQWKTCKINIWYIDSIARWSLPIYDDIAIMESDKQIYTQYITPISEPTGGS